MNINELYKLYQENPSVQTDTRKLKAGDIFFALKGPNFNGNEFAQKALDAGAAYVVVDEEFPGNQQVIKVADTLRTLQGLALMHRDHFKIPFIAITGSNGKTTTKELMHAVLSTQFKTYTTTGNLNNHIGVPLTILKVREDAEMAVIEMGANHLGEIRSYCQYAKPDFGLITNIGKAHLEGFGGAEGVKKGKGELFEYLDKNGGKPFVNTDDPNIVELSLHLKNKIAYGIGQSETPCELISADPFVTVKMNGENTFTMSTQLVGRYNLSNILAAVAVGRYFKVSDENIKRAIEEYSPSNSRSQLIKKNGNQIILDAYNANPDSMKAAIENFAAMQGNHKILILGDMKELGDDTQKEHQQVIDLINKYPWKEVTLTGPLFSKTDHSFRSFENAGETKEWFEKCGFDNALILVKGSRSMQMEKVIE